MNTKFLNQFKIIQMVDIKQTVSTWVQYVSINDEFVRFQVVHIE